MFLTGSTTDRLSVIKTLDRNEPYKIGVNGVFNVQPDYVEYEIDDVLYKTFFKKTRSTIGRGQASSRAPYIDSSLENLSRPTKFKINIPPNDYETYPLVKEEEKLDQVFLPEIKDEIFMERGIGNIYEIHMRLMDIKNIGQLEIYKNGFYNIKRI